VTQTKGGELGAHGAEGLGGLYVFGARTRRKEACLGGGGPEKKNPKGKAAAANIRGRGKCRTFCRDGKSQATVERKKKRNNGSIGRNVCPEMSKNAPFYETSKKRNIE